MATIVQEEKVLRIETNCYRAAVQTEGYVSGVGAGCFFDKRTGSTDLSFGLCIIDFLLEPGSDDHMISSEHHYHWGIWYTETCLNVMLNYHKFVRKLKICHTTS